MSLLTMIQETCDRLSLPRPSQVIGSTNPQVQTLLAIANEEGEKLAQRGQWQQLIVEATFSADAGTNTGDATEFVLETVAPGWDFQLNPTMWDRTQQNLVTGPITPAEYQANVAYLPMNIYYEWRVAQNKLLLYPPVEPVEGQPIQFAFEYITRYWCQSDSGTLQDTWQADTDTGLLNENLMSYGIEWRWNKKRGFAYQEGKMEYESIVNKRIGRGVTGRGIDITGRDSFRQRRVPWGNWPDY